MSKRSFIEIRISYFPHFFCNILIDAEQNQVFKKGQKFHVQLALTIFYLLGPMDCDNDLVLNTFLSMKSGQLTSHLCHQMNPLIKIKQFVQCFQENGLKYLPPWGRCSFNAPLEINTNLDSASMFDQSTS